MTAAIIQARVGSTRLPNKVFAEICSKPLIWHIINRIKYSKSIDKIVLATTINSADDQLENWAIENGIPVYRGSEQNVLERYYRAAEKFNADTIARITADDPFKDPVILDKVVELLNEKKLDFAYNNKPPSFPEGLDTEVFTFSALEEAYKNSSDNFEKEHVTQHFYRNPDKFSQRNFSYDKNISNYRWTIDTQKDLEMAIAVYSELYHPGEIFLMDDILKLINRKPWISEMNSDVKRSTMYSQS